MLADTFKDKVIIITGASSGIGLASARLFGSFGAKVVMAARSLEKLESEAPSVSACADNVLCVKTDVTREEDCRNLVEKTVERFGRIDILVNNAGISMRAMFKDLDLKVIRALMDVNFWGTVQCTKYALPYLLASKGSVVGVISIAGYSALPARTGYSSSKYAVRGFLDTLRIEHLKDGLNVLVERRPERAGVRPGLHGLERAQRGAHRRRNAPGQDSAGGRQAHERRRMRPAPGQGLAETSFPENPHLPGQGYGLGPPAFPEPDRPAHLRLHCPRSRQPF